MGLQCMQTMPIQVRSLFCDCYVPSCMRIFAHTRMGQSHTRMGQSHTRIPIWDAGNPYVYAELEIAVGHRPFSDQFQDLADQNRYARTQLLYISNGESNDMFLFSINGRPICNPYFKHWYGMALLSLKFRDGFSLFLVAAYRSDSIS